MKSGPDQISNRTSPTDKTIPGRQARPHQEHEDAAKRVEHKHHGVERIHDFLGAPQRLLVVGVRVVEERVPAILRNRN